MDLLSSRPFWPIRDGLPATFPPLERSASCEVAIVGAGITGAMIAQALAAEGRSVVVLDRREVAHGSTAGNTGLVLYELDLPLAKLSQRVGPERALRALERCRGAVKSIARWVRASPLECGFATRPSLYLAAARKDVGWLKREFQARRAAGQDIEWWGRGRLAAESSLPQPAGILSREAAQLDAYRLTYGLLLAAQRDGARVHDRTEVTRWTFEARGVRLSTARGAEVRAKQVVVATGYEASRLRAIPGLALHSTFALVTEPLARFPGWPLGGCMIWDTAEPYLYLRTTADGRAIIGGYDEAFRDPAARDRLLGRKVAALRRRLRQLFPRMEFEVATAWAGTFGVTADGLPLIGQHPEMPRAWFALGFGGNGTTFSVIAAEIIRGALCGKPDADAELFGFERLKCRAREAEAQT